MADIPTNGILRVVLSLLLPDNAIAQNVFYTLFENDGTSADDQDVLDDLVDWMEAFYTEIDGSVNEDVSVTGLKAYLYDTVGEDWDEVGVGFPSVTNVGASDPLPNGIAALMHAPTVDPDVTGAKYIAGFGETSALDNDWTAALLTVLAAAATEWTDPFTGATSGSGFIPGVWSVTNSAFYAFTTASSINVQVAYQRRRKPGVGI